MEKEYSQKYLQLNRDKSIVFEARELPFFRVPPDLSDLGRSSTMEQELQQRYPNLIFRLGCIVDGAVLISDLLAFTQTFDFETGDTLFNLARELNITSNITLQVVDGALANDFLLGTLCKPALRTAKPLFVFPGEGAMIVNEYVRRQEPAVYDLYDIDNAVYLPCERRMLRKGKFDIEVDYSPLPKNLNTRTVVIIDDVIATGQTIQTITEEIRKRYGEVNIVALSWFFLEPTVKENRESPSGIKGVNLTITNFALRGNYLARPPINSLSCFLREDVERYETVKQSFIERYIEDKEKFKRILEEMKP